MAKGNPNPSPATRFQPGENGRTKQKGDRDRLTAKFLYELAEDFEKNGKKAIAKVRTESPDRYIASIVALVPKQVEVKEQPLGAVPDDKLTEAIETLTEAIRAQVPQAPPPKAEDKPKVLQ